MIGARASVCAIGCAALLGACSEDRAGGPPADVGVHAAGVADPTSAAFHGAALRREGWAGMLDPKADDACGRCREGSPAPVPGVTSFAPGATPCTTCHAEPRGPLACTTCHEPGGPHRAHLAPSASSAMGLSCTTCHPVPGLPVIGGLHGNGTVDVVFDASKVTPEATYDPATRACAVACHDRGGARPRPSWNDTAPVVCGDCHATPPAGHFPGACTSCHAEPDATGTKLTGGLMHMNGKVDLGDGRGTCASCHGRDGDAWPSTGAHTKHAGSALSDPIACGDCHEVPTTVLAPGHLDDGVAKITFSGLATARQSSPTWDGQRCSSVACHGAGLVDVPAVVPAWRDTSGEASACGACHGLPPTQHTPSTSCGRSNCHGPEVSEDAKGALSISASGAALHANGVIDHAP